MELVCVRHGRTAWNAELRFQGQTDVPPDDEGRAQIAALAVHLRGEHFDRAVASDLTRARETAEAICAGRDLTLVLDPGLREMRFGVWEGLTWSEIAARWPTNAEQYGSAPGAFTPEGAESFADLCARVEPAVRRATAGLGEQARVLIVSHAVVMHAMLHIAGGVRDADNASLRVRLLPASIARIRGSFEGGWTVIGINETADAREVSA